MVSHLLLPADSGFALLEDLEMAYKATVLEQASPEKKKTNHTNKKQIRFHYLSIAEMAKREIGSSTWKGDGSNMARGEGIARC